jgi:peptide/nickel transport system permease protein
MFAFLGRSLVQKTITLFFVSIISFAVVHLAPGSPSQVDPMNPKFTKEMVERFRQQFHLDKPLYQQYLLFYRDLFAGKSTSWKDGRSVLAKIYERFLNSLPLFVVGTLITWTLSFPVGIQAAIKRGLKYDRMTTIFA